MKETKNVPQLRFSGFDDEWENKEFSELFERRMERNNGQFGYDRWISVAKMYFQKPDKVTSNNIDTRTYVMRKSDIAFEGHSNKDYKLGRFVENDIGDGVISELFPIYKHIASYDLNYWKYAIQIERIMFPKLTKCIEISYTSSNKLDEYFFLKEHVLVPSCSEQKKIGTFISHVDSLIQAKTKKLESLKAVKKSLLQKCFPKAGQKVPEMRFAGFNGDWEYKEFKDITVSSGKKNKDNEPYVSYSITNENGFVLQDEKFENGGTMKDADKSMYWIVSPKSFAYNPARINVGSIGYQNLEEDVIVSSLYEIFKTSDDCCDEFLWHWFKSEHFNKLIQKLQEGGVRLYFYYDKLCMCGLLMPTLAEQQKIGQFFSKYDSLVSAQQKEIDKLKDIKKALLQKMFI